MRRACGVGVSRLYTLSRGWPRKRGASKARRAGMLAQHPFLSSTLLKDASLAPPFHQRWREPEPGCLERRISFLFLWHPPADSSCFRGAVTQLSSPLCGHPARLVPYLENFTVLKLTLCSLLSFSIFLKSRSCHHSPRNGRGGVHNALFTLGTDCTFPTKGSFPLLPTLPALGPTYTPEVVRRLAEPPGSS